MGQIDPATGHGLRMRTLDVGGMAARFLRVARQGRRLLLDLRGRGLLQLPTPFPPQFKVLDAPAPRRPRPTSTTSTTTPARAGR